MDVGGEEEEEDEELEEEEDEELEVGEISSRWIARSRSSCNELESSIDQVWIKQIF